MALGKRKQKQTSFWVETSQLQARGRHPFYSRLNEILDQAKFDTYAERICRKYYAPTMGRPSIAPGVYFRCFLVGYFEGIDSERGIAYRVSDSLSLREFLGLSLEEQTPDHSTLSKTRRLMNLGTHKAVFRWALKQAGGEGLLSGKNLGVDATTLEANAALKSIVRRDNGASYDEHVTQLMKTEGIEEPTPAERQRFDRKRKKSLSNRDWVNPHDREARITKMKDGRTHLAYKAEHAVDLETGAVVALTVQPADRGDTASMTTTLAEAGCTVTELAGQAAQADAVGPVATVSEVGVERVVADKGYHSKQALEDLAEVGVRTVIAEPERKRQTVDRTERGPGGGVCESAAAEHQDRQGADETAGGTGRTQLRPLVRYRRNAASSSAQEEQHRQTRPDSRRCLQSELDPAADVAGGHGPAGGGPVRRTLFCVSEAHTSRKRHSAGDGTALAHARPTNRWCHHQSLSRSKRDFIHGHRRQDPRRRHRQLEQPGAHGVEDRVGDHRAHGDDRRLAAALRRQSGLSIRIVSIFGSQEKRGIW